MVPPPIIRSSSSTVAGRSGGVGGSGAGSGTGASSPVSSATVKVENNNRKRRQQQQQTGILPTGTVGSNNTAAIPSKRTRVGGVGQGIAVATPIVFGGSSGGGFGNAAFETMIKREGGTTTTTTRAAVAVSSSTTTDNNQHDIIKAQFLKLFEEPEYQNNGIPNSLLKERFRSNYSELVPVINELVSESRLSMSQNIKGELVYNTVSVDLASKMIGLDAAARMVYQVIEKADTMGIWTKIIRSQTNIEQQTLNKIFKVLETRKLIKPVKSVTAKSKKLYMLYELTPAKELTGGVWYNDLEFDHEFINELRSFILQCVRRLNDGKGISCKHIMEKMIQAKVSKVELSINEVQQILETLVLDYMVEETTGGDDTTITHASAYDNTVPLYAAARRVTPMCKFKWWDSVLSPDFKYRTIRFEDGVTLSAHEPHYHT